MENYKVTFSTIGDFEILQTIIVNYLILPVVSLVMFLLIIYDTGQDFRRVFNWKSCYNGDNYDGRNYYRFILL